MTQAAAVAGSRPAPRLAPLSGLRVLDFSNLVPGPLASLLLAEAGAEVLKIERPGGDELRGYPPRFGDAGAAFALLNRGKTSLVADLKLEADRAAVRGLARGADVLIEQFRPGVMARLGLGYDELARDNPRLVYCSITGWGQAGARAQQAGHDLNYMAEAGLLGLARGADGAPVLPPVLAADIGAGAYPAVIDILLALQLRASTGRGCHLDVAMADNLFAFAYAGLASGQTGAGWPRPGGELTTGGSPRYGIYRTSDGAYLAAAPIEERFWIEFCVVLGLDPRRCDDPRDPQGSIGRVAARIAQLSAEQWRERFAGRDVCVSVVASLEQARRDPAFSARGLFEPEVVAQGRDRMAALPLPLAAAVRVGEGERPAPSSKPVAAHRSWSTTSHTLRTGCLTTPDESPPTPRGSHRS